MGRFGDVAVFAHDPFALDLRALPELEADSTIVDGRIVRGETESSVWSRISAV